MDFYRAVLSVNRMLAAGLNAGHERTFAFNVIEQFSLTLTWGTFPWRIIIGYGEIKSGYFICESIMWITICYPLVPLLPRGGDNENRPGSRAAAQVPAGPSGKKNSCVHAAVQEPQPVLL